MTDPTVVVSIITGLFALATTVLTLWHQRDANARASQNKNDHADVLGLLQTIDGRLDDHLAWHAHTQPTTEGNQQHEKAS